MMEKKQRSDKRTRLHTVKESVCERRLIKVGGASSTTRVALIAQPTTFKGDARVR